MRVKLRAPVQAQSWTSRAAGRAAIVASGFALTFWAYHAIVTNPNYYFTKSDDRSYFVHAADGFSMADVFMAYSDHLVPVIRFIYFLLYSIAGTWWPFYGALALVGHATLCALVGLTVERFSGSALAALAVTCPLVVSMCFANGVMFQFAIAFNYWMFGLLLAAPMLLWWYLTTGSRAALWSLLGSAFLLTFSATQGLFVYAVVGVHHLAMKYVLRARGRRLVDRRDVAVWGGLAVVMVLYAVALWAGFEWFNNRLPGSEKEFRPPGGDPTVVRALNILTYALIGWLIPLQPGQHIEYVPDLVLHTQSALRVVLVLLIGALAWGVRARRGDAERLLPPAMGLASLTLAVLFAVMAVAGRRNLVIVSIRYNIGAVIYIAIAAGTLLAMGIEKLTGRRLTAAVTSVALLSLIATMANFRASRAQLGRYFHAMQINRGVQGS